MENRNSYHSDHHSCQDRGDIRQGLSGSFPWYLAPEKPLDALISTWSPMNKSINLSSCGTTPLWWSCSLSSSGAWQTSKRPDTYVLHRSWSPTEEASHVPHPILTFGDCPAPGDCSVWAPSAGKTGTLTSFAIIWHYLPKCKKCIARSRNPTSENLFFS